MMTRYSTPTLRRCDYPVIYTPTPLGHAISACRVFFFFFQAEDGIRDAQESRGLGDVYKRQDQLLLGFAVADISYVSEVFVYAALRNRKGAKLEKGAKFEYMSMSPLALGVRMAPASTQGCTEAKDLWGSEVRVCAEEGGGWKVSLDVRVRCAKTQAPGRLSAEFGILPPVEPLSLLIPLRGTEGQLGYTMKAGGLKAIGRVLLLSLIHI
eukprot:TRINITY_DN6737_c0_g2_i5.p1 TRINITY_DN6737_c0_g2~~TRINITY_DN6737_c0_g2_i5.p1  ORF type:complete len:210 (-),score=38.29 TRINITY_DN6737_c0_g2_i5:2-631(-)